MLGHPEFTEAELEDLAAFVCDRVDSLRIAMNDPRITSEEYKKGCRKVVRQLSSLNEKLRPYYTGPKT